MKTLGKIKLNQFSKVELEQRALNALKGGCACVTNCGSCTCTCDFGFQSAESKFADSGNSLMDDGGVAEY